MENYINLLIKLLEKEAIKNRVYINQARCSEQNIIEELRKNIQNIELKIKYLKSGKVEFSYFVIPSVHTNTILNSFIFGDLSWFGSSKYSDIEETCYNLSKKYNISLYDSLQILELSDKLMSLNASANYDPIFKEVLEKTNLEIAKRYKTVEELEKEIKIIEKKITFLLNKKHITSNEFAKKYILYLELYRGFSTNYDKFLDWFNNSVDYGVISSFCESDEYGNYFDSFLREKIVINDFK